MTKRIPAIPTEYNGIKFRSKLEAKYAKAFDSLGIPWLYEEVGFEFDDGIKYCPDFYLPDSKQFFEVKGLMFDLDRHKIENLALNGETIIVGDPRGNLKIYDNTGWYGIKGIAKDGEFTANEFLDYFPLDGAFCRCIKCGSFFFFSPCDYFGCRCCGEYDGDHHMTSWSYNVFTAQPQWFERHPSYQLYC